MKVHAVFTDCAFLHEWAVVVYTPHLSTCWHNIISNGELQLGCSCLWLLVNWSRRSRLEGCLLSTLSPLRLSLRGLSLMASKTASPLKATRDNCCGQINHILIASLPPTHALPPSYICPLPLLLPPSFLPARVRWCVKTSHAAIPPSLCPLLWWRPLLCALDASRATCAKW